MPSFDISMDPTAASEVRFRPRGSRPITVGVLCSEVSNGYSQPISLELSAVAREYGVRLVTFVEWLTPEDIQSGRAFTTDLASPARLDALLVLPLGATLTAEDLAGYVERFRPLPVCVVPDIANDWCSRVRVENESGMRAVIGHLLDVHGRRRVAFVRGPEGSDEAELRFELYKQVLASRGIAFDPDLVAPGYYVLQSGVDAVRLLLDERKVAVDAFACANDGMAFGVLDALRARGLRVPEDIAVVGFDDVDLARYVEPPLTTARQPLRELGRLALRMLLRQLEQGQRVEHVVLPSRLVVRDSCGCNSVGENHTEVDQAPRSVDPGRETMLSLATSTSLSIRALDIPGAPSAAWEEGLCRAFVSDVWSGSNDFQKGLRELLRGMSTARGDVGGFHRVVSILRGLCHDSLAPGSYQQTRAETLLHAARVATSGASERAQSNRQLHFEDFTYKLTRTNSALGRAVDLAGISAVLAADLPAYGIDACYVCVYEPREDGPLQSRLLAGFGVGTPDARRTEFAPFPSQELIPDAALVESAPMQYLIGPLQRGTSTGYAAFAYGPEEGFVYENLLDQLGGALARLSLTERLMREAALREAAERARLEREFAIAEQIQNAILPKNFLVPGLEIAALTQPSSEVGGDYYDVLGTDDGCWIGIGDVAGHGLPTGLVMLMLQSVVSGLLRANPTASPRAVLLDVNAVLYENIRVRMRQDEYVTLTLIHCHKDGRLTFAGAHEDMLVYRAREGRCEWIATPGTWVGARSHIAETTIDSSNHLELDDVLVLFTDGVTEARSASGEFYGQEHLAEVVARVSAGGASIEAIRDAVIADLTSFTETQSDDFSVLVARRRPLALT